MREHGWTTVNLVRRESPERFHARNPFPVGGVVEDPATGAAAAALGGYLRTLGLVDRPATIAIRQGEDMGRPSDLLIEVSPQDERTRVTGRAVPIAWTGRSPGRADRLDGPVAWTGRSPPRPVTAPAGHRSAGFRPAASATIASKPPIRARRPNSKWSNSEEKASGESAAIMG